MLVQLAASMRAHRRGGALLVVPSANRRLARVDRDAGAVRGVDRRSTELADRVVRAHSLERQEDLRRAVDALAGLTAVDGATLITDRYDLHGVRREDHAPARQPAGRARARHRAGRGQRAPDRQPDQLGGTRHLSAAQFVYDQHDAIALVASQDGRFTIFKWSPHEDIVHAHRVDALLL